MIRVTGPKPELEALALRAREELEDLSDGADQESSDWVFDVEGIGRIGFSATIGGYNDVSSFLLMLASIDGVRLAIES